MPINRINCDLCKSTKLRIIYRDVLDYESNIKEISNILICEKCNLIQQSKIFSNNEIKEFYEEDYHGRNYSKDNILSPISQFLRARYYKRFILNLESKTNKRDIKVLDYGSGDGFLCHLLMKRGFKNVYSCDFFEPTVCKTLAHIHPDQISEYEEYFDAIFMINSIEHLASFSKDFDRLDRSMKNSSLLIIETPNFDSIDSYLFKKFWGGLHQPRHTFLWSKNTLFKHLKRWNYDSKCIGSPQSAHWAISIQNFLSNKFPLFKILIKNGRIPGYLILVLIFLPLAYFQNFIKKESVLNIISIRKVR